jgi:hypothetical protein
MRCTQRRAPQRDSARVCAASRYPLDRDQTRLHAESIQRASPTTSRSTQLSPYASNRTITPPAHHTHQTEPSRVQPRRTVGSPVRSQRTPGGSLGRRANARTRHRSPGREGSNARGERRDGARRGRDADRVGGVGHEERCPIDRTRPPAARAPPPAASASPAARRKHAGPLCSAPTRASASVRDASFTFRQPGGTFGPWPSSPASSSARWPR